MNVEIEVHGPGRATLSVDGHDISHGVRAFELKHAYGDIAQLTVDVPIINGTHASGEARVVIPTGTTQALRALGWTPPGGQSPEYVHRLLDAYLRGGPLNLQSATLPADISARLDALPYTVEAPENRPGKHACDQADACRFDERCENWHICAPLREEPQTPDVQHCVSCRCDQ